MYKLLLPITACLALISCQVIKNQSVVEASTVKSMQISPIVENSWKVMSTAAITEILQVSYTNAIGIPCTDTCMVVFETGVEYKLVAPWISGPGMVLQKHNITGFNIKKLSVL